MEHIENEKIILLNKPFDKQSFIKSSEIIMEINAKLIRKEHVKILMLALMLILIGILSIRIGFISIFLFVISALLVLLVIVVYFNLRWLKKKIKIKTQALCEKYELIDFKSNYEIDKDGMSYSDNDKDIKYKWKDFKCCYLYKNYIILFDYKLLKSYYAFENNEFFSDNYKTLLNFVQTNLKIKRIN